MNNICKTKISSVFSKVASLDTSDDGALPEITVNRGYDVELNSTRSYITAIALCFAVIMLNTVATTRPSLGLIIGVISHAVALCVLVFRGPYSAFIMVMLFASCSFESEAYVMGVESSEKLYGFASMPVIGFSGILALVSLCYVVLVWRHKPSQGALERHPILRNANRCLNLMLVSGVIMFSLAYITNDNTIANQSWYLRTAVGEASRDAFCILALKFLITSVLMNPQYIKRLVFAMTSLLVALSLSGLIVSLLGWHGVYYNDNTETILSPLSHVFASSLLLIGAYQKGAHRTVCVISGGISLIALLALYPSPLSGTWAVMQVLLLIMLLLVHISVRWLSVIILSTAIVISVIPAALGYLGVDELVQYKFGQATDLVVSAFTGEDVSESAHSASNRVDEFVNAAWELFENPQYLLFGKGFGGSTAHHTDSVWNDSGDFSSEQVKSGVFIRLHTTPSILLLKHGLIGLGFFVLVFVTCVFGIRKTPWVFLGIYWLMFYFASFSTMTLLGCAALVIGVYEVE